MRLAEKKVSAPTRNRLKAAGDGVFRPYSGEGGLQQEIVEGMVADPSGASGTQAAPLDPAPAPRGSGAHERSGGAYVPWVMHRSACFVFAMGEFIASHDGVAERRRSLLPLGHRTPGWPEEPENTNNCPTAHQLW